MTDTPKIERFNVPVEWQGVTEPQPYHLGVDFSDGIIDGDDVLQTEPVLKLILTYGVGQPAIFASEREGGWTRKAFAEEVRRTYKALSEKGTQRRTLKRDFDMLFLEGAYDQGNREWVVMIGS